jgi:hypothetical protein
MLPLVAYVFSDGPWRDTHVRFGYDPRQDIEARMLVPLSFLVLSTHVKAATSVSTSATSIITKLGLRSPRLDRSEHKSGPPGSYILPSEGMSLPLLQSA